VAWLGAKRLCLLGAAVHMLLGWRVGVWLSFPSGNEETPPTCRIAVPSGIRREPWQRSRNETSTWRVAMMHVKLLSLPCGNGETAVLQVERANRRR
jgi:hypothetical protein